MSAMVDEMQDDRQDDRQGRDTAFHGFQDCFFPSWIDLIRISLVLLPLCTIAVCVSIEILRAVVLVK